MKETLFKQLKVLRFSEVDSTQLIAKKLAESGQECLVVAESQRGGYGRRRRSWFSPKGGLWFSLALRPDIDAKDLPKLQIAIVLSLVDFLREEVGLEAGVKWPNDVVVGKRKICGVLLESKLGDKVEYVVVGVGLNVNVDSFPENLRNVATSLLLETGREYNLRKALNKILERFSFYYRKVLSGEVREMLSKYKRYNVVIGRQVLLELKNGVTVKGTVLDVTEDNQLVLRTEKGTLTLSDGEVDLVR